MGCISSHEEDKVANERSRHIDKAIKKERNEKWREFKILLLGTGASGKSTIVKQMKIINDNGYDEKERLKYRVVIFMNAIEGLIVIVKAMDRLEISFANPERLNDVQTLLNMTDTAERNSALNSELFIAMKALWADEGVQKCFGRSREYQLEDSVAYYLDELDRIGDANYIPSEQDVLRTRVTTTGISETVVTFNDIQMRLVDVGGQRTERRKWIHCFDNVDAIIFIVALSEYDLMLFEDPTVNRMKESLRLFDSMCNNPIFKSTCMILFLNKKDIFAEKIQYSPLNTCFPEYMGENNYESGVYYVRMKFESCNNFPDSKIIFTHETCATDTGNVKKVFSAIRVTIMKRHLEQDGLL